MLWEVAIHYWLNKDDLHDLLKVGYKIKSTTLLNYDQWYEYIDNIHYFIACVFDMYFDPERHKLENISFEWLYGSMQLDVLKNHYPKPSNLKSLF